MTHSDPHNRTEQNRTGKRRLHPSKGTERDGLCSDDGEGDLRRRRRRRQGSRELRRYCRRSGPYRKLTTDGREPEFLALKHESRILRHLSNPVSGFSMMEHVKLCAV